VNVFPFHLVLSYASRDLDIIRVPCQSNVFYYVFHPMFLFLWAPDEMNTAWKELSFLIYEVLFSKHVRHVEFDKQFAIFTLNVPTVHGYLNRVTYRFNVANITSYCTEIKSCSGWYHRAFRMLCSVWRAQNICSWLSYRHGTLRLENQNHFLIGVLK
jgi:hypothetical protein